MCVPLLVPDFFGNVIIHFTPPGPGGEQIVTFGVGFTDPFAPTDVLDQLETTLNGFWVSNGSDDYAMTSVDLVVGATLPPYSVYTRALGGAGGETVDDPPPPLCVVVQKRTPVAGRAGRGRFFWPGLLDVTDVQESGMLDGTKLSYLQTQFDTLIVAIETSDDMTGMFVLHEDTSPVADPSLILDLTVRQQVTWLRSREY